MNFGQARRVMNARAALKAGAATPEDRRVLETFDQSPADKARESETPRTDATLGQHNCWNDTIKVARQLERELRKVKGEQ